MTQTIALGVDWYGKGWVAVVLRPGDQADLLIGTDLERLIGRVEDAACVGVDMPIGLPEEGVREADQRARRFVGPRRNSVFMTPPQRVLDADSYEEANAIAPSLTGGKKISTQAWALRENIQRIASVAARDARVVEVHPEVSFRAMAGCEIAAKTTWNGQALRRRCLEAQGIVLPDQLAEAGKVPVADVLDAAAAAWSARRYAEDEALSLPPGSSRGERQVIWY